MKKIITGNLDQQIVSHPETKGWFLGCFMAKYPEFLSDDVELKWARHKKGDIKPGLSATSTTKTFTILISGKFFIRFPELNQEVTLAQLGDFVFYDASQTSHKAEASEDSLLLVIRYPSR
ncbi:MAG: signal peptidase I [Patescibacteria group bacterium]